MQLENRPGTGRPHAVDAAAMLKCHGLYDGQSKTGAVTSGREKWIEYLVAQIGGHARTIVADGDTTTAAAATATVLSHSLLNPRF